MTPTEAAEGDDGIYWPQTRQVLMTGNVLLTQGPNTVAGDKMTADLGTGIGKVEGRVRSVLQQQPRQPQPAGQPGGAGSLPAPAPALVQGDAGLRVVGLRKSYRKRPVIRDVSLELHRGEVVALLGPNGSGKTTTFYAIAGLISPDGGKVLLDGRDVTLLPMYRRARLGIGYLPQEVSIFRGLSVEDNIMAILEIATPDRTVRSERLEELLSEFSIEHLRRARALSLSGGERRRVEIARCLAASPQYVLMDEPFAGVDPIAVGDIRALVSELKTRGIGVLITDHNVRETLEIVDRAYILHDGQVLMSGTTQDVVRNENVRRVYLGQGFRID